MRKSLITALVIAALATLARVGASAQASGRGVPASPTLVAAYSQTFADVPASHPYYAEIEWLYQNGYTAGCAVDPLRYCPDATMNRAESAVFVERGIHNASYDPPVPTTQVFADLALDSWAAKWVNGLWVDQYTAGCGTNPLVYCPWQGHTRAEGCVFYLRMLRGANYEPAQPAQQTFVDVPLEAWYAKWIQAAYDAGLITACQSSPDLKFCPDDPLSRGLAAYMMVHAKSSPGRVFYVSPDGSDSNPGTITSPWRTLFYASGKLRAGDTLYVRGGTYAEDRIYIGSSYDGTQEKPIRISAYDREKVILDGNYSASASVLVQLYGDWVTVSNITVTESGGTGVASSGQYNTVDNVFAHHNWGWGIVMSGDHNLAQNCKVWSNSMMNENHSSTSWGGGITCARYPDSCTIRNCISWANWGEGISTFETMHTTIEDSVSYDNMQNFYISDTKFTTFRRNLAYCTPGNANDAGVTQNGILVGDEKGVPNPLPDGPREASSNNTFVNNVVIGCNRNLAASPGKKELQPGLGNNLYAHNTLVNAGGIGSELTSVMFYTGLCTGCRFVNNIVVQEDNLPAAIYGSTGYSFSNNLWSKPPPSAAYNQATDIIADPLLTRTGTWPPDPVAPGTPYPFSGEWFKIQSTSPAIDEALALPEVVDDYFRAPRPFGTASDIGAHEVGTPMMQSRGVAFGEGETFTDVPLDHPYHAYIEALYQAGYTAGCATAPLRYCPDLTMNRAESAVFVERGIHSTSYSPSMPTSQVFADLALDSWAAGWVDGLWDDAYTAGCGTDPLIYCPWQGHTRAEGAVFYLRMLNGANFVPPDPTQPTFSDVPLDAWYAGWVEAAYADGLIPPCQTSPALRFCPDDPLSRGLAAYMMVQAKHLAILPPAGLYHSCWPANQSCLDELQIMHDGGFTYTINYSDFDYDIETILAYASKLESLGMKTFWDMSRPNYAQGSMDPQYVIDRVNAVKGSPATAGYYVGDEFNTTAADVEWISSVVRQADPDPAHRTLFIHFYQIPDCMVVARPYSVPHLDALGLDLYAFANDRQSDDVALCSKAGQEWDDGHDKDWVAVLQAFRGTDYGLSNDFPSRERMRLERDLALQNSRPLVVFWWWYPSAQQTGHWDDLVWAANGK